MTDARSVGHVALVLFLVVGLTVPAAAVSAGANTTQSVDSKQTSTTMNASASSSVNVTVGHQLSTVIDVSSDNVRTDFENTAFEMSIEAASEEERAEAIADRAAELHDRAEDIREEYDDATEAYEGGEITVSAYARQLATLNARATNVLDSYAELRQRSETVSAFELQAAGLNQSALQANVESLNSVSGAGSAAILEQFTGESRGEIALETEGGLSIDVRREDGGQSREIERPADGNTSITIAQSAALETARASLSSPETGSWVLAETEIEQDDGTYEFEFALRGAADSTGESEVIVDGSSGAVVELDEEIAVQDDENEEDETDEEDGNLAMIVVEGTPAPGETVVIEAMADGAPAGNVDVYLNDRHVGTTDADGRITVTLPDSDGAELTAQAGDVEGVLGIEFEDDGDDLSGDLYVDASIDGETVAVSVSYDGSGVANATVYANGQRVGTTDADGSVTFTTDVSSTETLEIDIVKGEFTSELDYELQDGSLTLIESDTNTGISIGDDEDDDTEISIGDDEDDEDDEDDTELNVSVGDG